MGYYNPIHARGADRFAREAAGGGVDGLHHRRSAAGRRRGAAQARSGAPGLDVIRLVTPTTHDARLAKVLDGASGYLYYVSITGVTGTKSFAADDVKAALARIRKASTLPVAVGFGIKTPAQAAQIARIADAAVVGSAIVDIMAEQSKGRPQGQDCRSGHGTVPALADSIHAASGAKVRRMNWITNLVRPRIKKLMSKDGGRETPENLWRKCSACGEMVFHRDLVANFHVCPNCGHHMRIGPAERFAYTFDRQFLSRIAAAAGGAATRCASRARSATPTR